MVEPSPFDSLRGIGIPRQSPVYSPSFKMGGRKLARRNPHERWSLERLAVRFFRVGFVHFPRAFIICLVICALVIYSAVTAPLSSRCGKGSTVPHLLRRQPLPDIQDTRHLGDAPYDQPFDILHIASSSVAASHDLTPEQGPDLVGRTLWRTATPTPRA